MRRLTRRLAATLILGLAGLAIGCGGGSKSITPDNPSEGLILNEVGEVYRTYSIMKGSPPEKLTDIGKLNAAGPAGIIAIQRGEIIVQWGAKLPDTGEEPGKVSAPEILAYQKQVPEQGGYVLQLDRTIKKMTADEFKTAPKAGKN